MSHFTFSAQTESDTERLGAALAEIVPDGTTVALCGTLGAGKTRLTQAIVETCGVPRENVTSPTFVLSQEYHGRRTVYHLDAYRVRNEDEFWQLGPDEYFESPGITVVEWADRVPGCLPPKRIEIHIDVTGDQSREFRVAAIGEKYQSVVEALRLRLTRGGMTG
jgi:tRNA threonylcarbamoyladenosine biosynthesis protein TsaE